MAGLWFVVGRRAGGVAVFEGAAEVGLGVEHRADGASSWTTAAADHTATSLTISSGINAATSYTVRVKAKNDGGQSRSVRASITLSVRVKAKNDGGQSAWTASAAAAPPDPDALHTPANPDVTITRGRAHLEWDAAAGATGYEYRVKATGATEWEQWWHIWAGDTERISIHLRPNSLRPWTAGQDYLAQVRSVYDRNGTTRYSDPTTPVQFTMLG